MDHQGIDDGAYVDRYVNGGLVADERDAFEEHLLDCPRCVEQVAWAEDFRGALRAAAAEAALPRRPRPRSLALPIAAALAAVALGGVLVARYTGDLREQLARSDAGAAGWRSRYEAERQSAEAARLAAQPQANVPALLLSAVRSGAASPAPLAIPSDARWVVLSLELEGVAEHAGYRVRLSDSGGREVWQTDGVRAVRGAPVSLLIPAQLLAAGEHRLLVEGVRPDGRADPAGLYVFRVLPRAP